MSQAQGWTDLEGKSKDHYFRGGWSLCSKVPYLPGTFLESAPTGNFAGPNDCRTCWAKKRKEEA